MVAFLWLVAGFAYLSGLLAFLTERGTNGLLLLLTGTVAIAAGAVVERLDRLLANRPESPPVLSKEAPELPPAQPADVAPRRGHV